jgi:hypothetical protein
MSEGLKQNEKGRSPSRFANQKNIFGGHLTCALRAAPKTAGRFCIRSPDVFRTACSLTQDEAAPHADPVLYVTSR